MRKNKVLVSLLILVMVTLMPATAFASPDKKEDKKAEKIYKDMVVSHAGVGWQNLNSLFGVPQDEPHDFWKPAGDPATLMTRTNGKAVVSEVGSFQHLAGYKNVFGDYKDKKGNIPQAIWSTKYSQNIFNGDVAVFTDTFDIQGKTITGFDLTFTGDDGIIITINDRYVASWGINWKQVPAVGGILLAENIRGLMGGTGPLRIHEEIQSRLAVENYLWDYAGKISSKDINNYQEFFKSKGNLLKVYVLNGSYSNPDLQQGLKGTKSPGTGNVAYVLYGLSVTSKGSFDSDHDRDRDRDPRGSDHDSRGSNHNNSYTIQGNQTVIVPKVPISGF